MLIDGGDQGRPGRPEPERRRPRPALPWRTLLPAAAPTLALAGAATQPGAVGAGFAFAALALTLRALARWVDGFGLHDYRQ